MIFKEKCIEELRALQAIQIILNNIEVIKKNVACEGYIDNTLIETFKNEMFDLRRNVLDDAINYDEINKSIDKEVFDGE